MQVSCQARASFNLMLPGSPVAPGATRCRPTSSHLSKRFSHTSDRRPTAPHSRQRSVFSSSSSRRCSSSPRVSTLFRKQASPCHRPPAFRRCSNPCLRPQIRSTSMPTFSAAILSGRWCRQAVSQLSTARLGRLHFRMHYPSRSLCHRASQVREQYPCRSRRQQARTTTPAMAPQVVLIKRTASTATGCLTTSRLVCLIGEPRRGQLEEGRSRRSAA